MDLRAISHWKLLTFDQQTNTDYWTHQSSQNEVDLLMLELFSEDLVKKIHNKSSI